MCSDTRYYSEFKKEGGIYIIHQGGGESITAEKSIVKSVKCLVCRRQLSCDKRQEARAKWQRGKAKQGEKQGMVRW